MSLQLWGSLGKAVPSPKNASLPCPKIDTLNPSTAWIMWGIVEALPIQGLLILKQMLPFVTKEGNMSLETTDATEKNL